MMTPNKLVKRIKNTTLPEAIRDVIVMVIASMTVMETNEYEEFKQGENPNNTRIDNVQITLLLFDKQED